jgi:hypothetical protein
MLWAWRCLLFCEWKTKGGEMNIVKLRDSKINQSEPKPNQSCIDLLREILKMAETGEITFAIIIATKPDGCVVDGWSQNETAQPYTVLGALAAVSHRFDDENIQR